MNMQQYRLVNKYKVRW